MFDIGFWELAIIGVVALIVIGPERLPGVARTAGLWFGRMRRFVTTVKADIDRELKAEELQQVLQRQADSAGLHEIIEETRETVGSVGKETREAVEGIGKETEEYLVKSEESAGGESAAPGTGTESKQQENDSKA